MSAVKVRTGRPLKEHPSGTLVTITLQVPAELKAKLQDAALKSSRTLSAEAQRRLERSFSTQALQEDAIALAVESALGEHSRRMTERLNAHLADLSKLKAEQEQRLAERVRELEELAKRSQAK